MKRHLYGVGYGWPDHLIPPMPRVLAEKTAREMSKADQRAYRRRYRFKAFKTDLVTKDSSPRGLKEWYPLWNA